MAIRYFATNRDMDRLSRERKREERLALQKGGHYFIDMEKYMRHYLATVETDSLPPEAAIADSETAVFERFLARPSVGKVVVCVHGFNVQLYEAYTWFRILTDTLRHIADCEDCIVTDPGDPLLEKAGKGRLTAFIGFSWPSNGRVIDYLSDQRDAAASGQALANLLGRIHLAGKSVNLVCHSMGNYLACHMLAGLVNHQYVPACFSMEALRQAFPKEGEAGLKRRYEACTARIGRGEKAPDSETVEKELFFVDRFVMLAPDVERRHVTKCSEAGLDIDYVGPFYSGLQHLVRSPTNVYSRFDGTLGVSNLEKMPREAVLSLGDRLSGLTLGLLDFLERNPDQKWEKRLGEGPHPPNAPPNFTSINATELAGRKIDHSDHVDSREIVAKLARALEIPIER